MPAAVHQVVPAAIHRTGLMRRIAPQIMILALLLSCMICPEAPECGVPTDSRPETTVLIVSGISKDPNDQATRDQAMSGLREHLLKRMNVDPQRLMVLTADASPASSLQSTVSQISRVMDTFASTVRPDGQVHLLLHRPGQCGRRGVAIQSARAGYDAERAGGPAQQDQGGHVSSSCSIAPVRLWPPKL